MHKIVLLSIFINISILNLNASQSIKDEYLQIVANNLEQKDSILTAQGDIIIYSEDYYITAKKMIYDKNTTNLELFGDVNILKDDNLILFSQYASLNIKNKDNFFKPMLVIENKQNIWFKTNSSEHKGDIYNLEESVLSSCDCKNPDWTIQFDKGDYNSTRGWINTYQTTLYIKDIPIFYTPYFGFSTNTDRKTGFLKPTIGWSDNEGIFYAQPLYYAPSLNYDFELIPYIKTKRGYGNALRYRYADSFYSTLTFETSYFKEYDSYRKSMLLENEYHYGSVLNYKRDKLISNQNSTDGLLLNLIDINDIDYLNTKYDSDIMNYTNRYLESKIKYFYNTNRYYKDISFELYEDISTTSGNDLQNFPIVNFNKYSDTFLNKKLIYETNVKYKKTKIDDKTVDNTDINIPLSYNLNLFDDYLSILFKEDIYFINNTSNDKYSKNSASYGFNNHTLSLSTHLVKPYQKYLHSINFDTTIEKTNEFFINNDISNIDAFDLNNKNDISFSFKQSVTSLTSFKDIVSHSIKQVYSYDDNNKKYIKNSLENDIVLLYKNGEISNRINYDNKIKKISQSLSSFTFSNENYFTNLYHTYILNNNIKNESLTYDIGMEFGKRYTISYQEEFDLVNKVSRKKEYLFNIDRKCWDINFKITNAIVATNTVNDTTLRQNILYLELNLKKLFSINQYYKFKEERE